MRIRSIKPEFWRSSDISSLEIEDRLLFIGLWSYVDDNGVGRDKLSAIAADLFADDLERDAPGTFARVSRGLARLSEASRVVRYSVAGDDFLRVVNWEKHQRIDKPGKARYPSDDAENAVIRESVANAREGVAPGTGEQGNRGTGEQGSSAQPSAGLLFDEVWAAWPKKDDKKDAIKKWPVAIRESGMSERELADIAIEHGSAYRAHKSKQFTPAFVVWLNKARWNNEVPTGDQTAVDAWSDHIRKLGGRGEIVR